MSDDTSRRGPQDRSRVNVQQDHELQYWSKKWGISPEELKRIVDQVGPSTKDVARRLGKTE